MMHLTCYQCEQTAEFPDRKRCDCGEPLWFDLDTQNFDWPDADTRSATADRGVWRYADLLPVGSDDGLGSVEGVAAAAGDTPLVRAACLDDDAGCQLWLKDESENPTGSFKDRGSAVGVGWAVEAGREWVGTVSHGNMAISVSANAAGIGGPDGPNAVVLVPDDISDDRLAAIAQYGPEVLRVAGDYGDLYHETLAEDVPVEFVNSDTPLRVAGQKTTTLEICEAFAAETPRSRKSRAERLGLDASKLGADDAEETRPGPDAIVMPVSSGGHASAAWKALRELRVAGLLDEDRCPRLYLVQAAACDPIAQAYREGADEVTPVEADETVAYSIANADPPSGTRALTAARETDGAVVSVPDDEILDAKSTLAREAGFCVESACATTLAGIRRLSDRGELDRDESVVAVLTGTGFRELFVKGSRPEVVELADVADRLRDLAG